MGKVTLTAKQMKSLAPFEYNLLCARSEFLNPAGRKGTDAYRDVYKEVTGQDYDYRDACGHCEYDLAHIVQGWYFDTKEKMAQKKKEN